jgi:hypothetical protein
MNFFGRGTLLKHLRSLVLDRTIYQVYQRFRASGVAPSWRPLPSPYSVDEDGLLFSPVLVDKHQPVVLDLIPQGEEKGLVQITAKMAKWSPENGRHVCILRVITIPVRLSNQLTEVVRSVFPDVLFWLWLTRTLEQESGPVIAGLFRGSANLLKELKDDDGRVERLVQCVCSIKHLDLMDQDERIRSSSRNALCLTPPRCVDLCPRWDEEKKVGVAGFTVYTDDQANEAALEAYYSLVFGAKFRVPVPEWVKGADPKSLEFLESLVND